MPVDGSVVVITGATGHLGPVVARAFAAEKAKLALVARNQPALSQLVADLNLGPERCLAVPADLADPLQAESAARAVLERFGRADVLLALAGGYLPGAPVAELTLDDLHALLAINLITAFNAAHAFLPHLTANGWGRLIAISSVYGQQPAAKTAAYAAAKAALEALVLAVAQEGKSKGLTANVLVVRTIDSPAAREAAPKANTAAWTLPDEMANTMLFLCSDEAGAINGARIPLYGRG
jgi:NAD(P)-dependent dehydrogenase (short-subunit alcohol dehydrogenase family)